jgi:predicted Zn-dependent protease
LFARKFIATAAILASSIVLGASVAKAASVIRDAEIEATVAAIAHPLFEAAGLDADSVRVFIIRDDTLNAFVAGGQNLFLHTGLIIRTQSPEQLAGVIAHETGHIAGGHLSRTGDAIQQAQTSSIIGAVLGAAAAVAGAPQLGTAILAGGTTVAERSFLKFSRGQEQAADQAGFSYLEQVGWSPEGLVEFFEVLESQNLRITSEGDEYRRTHPLTRTRISNLRAQADQSPHRDDRMPDDLQAAHSRMVAKLDGFLANPRRVLDRYQGDEPDAVYARSIALFREANMDAAVEGLQTLIDAGDDTAYMHELIGQIRFESGDVANAAGDYRTAVEMLPDNALLRFGLGRALIETGDYDEAALHLKQATAIEPGNAGAWRFLGIAEGRRGNEGLASIALAESAVLTGNKEDAQLYLGRAKDRLSESDPAYIRILDLERALDSL